MFADHIKVLGGPQVARGPDVAQACYRGCPHYLKSLEMFVVWLFYEPQSRE